MLLLPSLKPEHIQFPMGWILFVLGLLATEFYVKWRIGPNTKIGMHLWIYGLAFSVWAYAVTGDQLLAFLTISLHWPALSF